MNEKSLDVSRVKEGDNPYDFEYTDDKGKKARISDLLSKKNVVVYFYPKDFTPGCTIEADEFSKNYELFKKNDIEIVGVSPDSDDSHNKFREKLKIPFMLSSDVNNSISKKYGVYGPKKFMGKEYLGVNRSTFLIDRSGKIVKIYHKVKPSGHYLEILDFFKAIKY